MLRFCYQIVGQNTNIVVASKFFENVVSFTFF